MLYNAGSEVYSQSICQELSKAHRVSVFSREENPFYPDFRIRIPDAQANPKLYLVNLPRGKDGYRHPEMDQVFDDLVQQLQPDIAHIGHLNHLSTGLVDVLHRRGIPIIFTLHDFWLMCPRGQFLQRNFTAAKDLYQLCHGQEDHKCAKTCYGTYFSGQAAQEKAEEQYWSTWIRNRMAETRRLAQKIDFFIAPSRHLRRRFIDDFGLSPEKVRYLDYGFPTHYLHKAQRSTGEPFTFGYIGTHIPAKGIHVLIEAFGQLPKTARLRIWGRERAQNTPGLKALAQQLQIPPGNIEWRKEYRNEHIVKDVFAHCDAIVVPSIWDENSPLVIHEAQACQVPVITADHGGMKEYVQHQVNGLLFQHRNPRSLAEQLNWALNHPASMKSLGQRAYLYDPEGRVPDIASHCQHLLQLYQQILKEHA